MYLTLGKASKLCGRAKPTILAAINKGRLSAHKNDSGEWQIDPSELSRVYPFKVEGVSKPNSPNLTTPNTSKSVSLTAEQGGSASLGLPLGERDRVLAEKDLLIEQLKEEKDLLRQDFEDQKEQNKRFTRVIEDHRSDNEKHLERAFKILEDRIANQEKTEKTRKERENKILKRNRALRKALIEEQEKSFFGKLFAGQKKK